MSSDRGEHTREAVVHPPLDAERLRDDIRRWGSELGFAQIGIADLRLDEATRHLQTWLDAGRHGTMHYMAQHAGLRADPQRLLDGAVRAITARMDYLPQDADPDWAEREWQRLREPGTAVVSLYARGRDYHKVLRTRLQTLAERIEAAVGAFGYRVATDSAPVFETELARKSGIGWRGKHTLVLAPDAGSMFFLGEILTDLPLPVDARHVLPLDRGVPDTRDYRPVSTRRTALHFIPDDRALGRDPGNAATAAR
jgi:epoxyqueuosine reductase